jgi:glucan-binding YG repeat protein
MIHSGKIRTLSTGNKNRARRIERWAHEITVKEATIMKARSLISTAVLLLLFGAAAPSYAQQEQHEQGAKPEKQEQKAKPQKQEQKAKPQKQEQQARPQKQQEKAKTPQNQEKSQHHQQQASGQQHEQAQGQSAHNGQKDSRGHEYNTSRFGRDHHARFEENGGRLYHGRRDYSYGGYWFYAGAYPAWFYQQDVYFIMGADGLWYAVAYGNPSLMFQVNIE